MHVAVNNDPMKTNRTCLLIDDDSDDQEIFVTAVADVSAATTCQVIADAKDALKFLARTSDLPDFSFLDINMPKMDGFEFFVELKKVQRLQRIPVIFYSTTKDEGQIVKATKLGASGFVTKTNDYNSLCKILKHILRDESYEGKEKFNFIL
jgi:CheY-like chemotaxis protein